MRIPRRGNILLIAFIALAWAGIAILQSHFAGIHQQREQALARDNALDRTFNARKPVPLEVRVMISTSGESFQTPADQPSFRQRIASLGKVPTIIVLPGCGFPVWGKDLPLNVAILSVDENPRLLDRKTSVEACMSKDGQSMKRDFEEQLVFLTNYAQRAEWIDKNRVMIAGYGEAAPLVAAYDGRVKQRLTFGDPCYVPWKNVSISTPVLMLFTSDRQGLERDDVPGKAVDITAFAQGGGPSFPLVKHCDGLARPEIQAPAEQVVTEGQLDMFERPAALLEAQKKAYNNL